MKIMIKETSKLEELTIRDKSNIEWTYDLIGNAGLTRNEDGLYEMTQEEYNWWIDFVKIYDLCQEEFLTYEQLAEVEESYLVNYVENNGNSGKHIGYIWYTVQLCDLEFQVYCK